jgi:hypothetical protein
MAKMNMDSSSAIREWCAGESLNLKIMVSSSRQDETVALLLTEYGSKA